MGSIVLIGTVSCVGSIALTAVLVRVPGLQTSGSGNAGQAFGAAAACASFFVLFYMARSFRLQADESRLRREEMAEQCEEMRLQRLDAKTGHDYTERLAQASVRGEHVTLMRLALEDQVLADVWPSYGPDIAPDRQRQFCYANLIISFQCMVYSMNYYTDDEVLEALRHLFSSPVIDAFWEHTRPTRARISPYGGKMRKFYELADLAWQSRTDDEAA
ncbi:MULTISPECIES: DUF6082 family protein [Streptacidiphilus]|uniref:DUF6082 family protein n=1 Tax=Streptacidiphilus cavernicola TaxID=3342716 RepID=A0ABV6ULF0_9ACTN|nr:DUF6082 family protein [Streptacidiphilus jeojiense]